MGTVIGLLVLAFIGYLIQRYTGQSLTQWVTKKYQTHLDAKTKKKQTK